MTSSNKSYGAIITILIIIILISVSVIITTSKKLSQKLQSITGINPYNDIMTPSGIKNNNPLNIRHTSAFTWKGEIITGVKDGEFAKFDTLHNGIRAAIVNLHSYVTKDKVNTIHTIINKWAPPSENDDASYEQIVMKQLTPIYTGITPNTILDGNYPQLAILAWAMSAVELGYKNQPNKQTFIDVQTSEFK